MEFNGKRGYGITIKDDKAGWLSILPKDNRSPLISIMADAEALPPSQSPGDHFSGQEGSFQYSGKGVMLRTDLLVTLGTVSRDQACCIL